MIDTRILEKCRAFPIEAIARRHNLELRGKIERVGPCPRCGGTDRFSINIKKRVFNCRGCQQCGDVISLVQFLDGCNFRQAIEILTGQQTDSPNHRPQQREAGQRSVTDDYECKQHYKAIHLWRASQVAAGTPAETYLRNRLGGDSRVLPATVRYLPPLKPSHRPAMLVPYGLTKITAVQLTLLVADGSDKAKIEPNKITIASPAGMPMVIAPPNDLLGLAITEGVEDALSVHYATGLGAWASGGAGFMPKLAPAVPNYVEAITIYAHADESGQRGAHELAEALDGRGSEVRIETAPPCHA